MNERSLSPVAIRAWAPPLDWKPKRRKRRTGEWPRAAFLLSTIARPVAGEPLRFGACALLPSLLPGQRAVDVRLFYPDDCPVEERELLAGLAAARGLRAPLSRAELVELLFKRTYRQRLPLVGFGLPAQLARLAAGWRGARDGSFLFTLWTQPCPPGRRTHAERRRRPILANVEIENGYRPRLRIKPLDGHGHVYRYTPRRQPDPNDLIPDGEPKTSTPESFPGYFLDLAQLATVQTGGQRHQSARAALAALHGEQHAPALAPAAQGDPGEAIDALLTELDLLAALYLRLLDCHHQTPGGAWLAPDQVYSAASYAEALLDQAGYPLPLQRDDLPDKAHALGMGAFFGGDSGIALRHDDRQVSYLDINGHYPLAAHLAGTFELLQASKLELVEEDPTAVREFLAGLSAERLLAEPGLWRRLARTVCLIQPAGELLPHRVERDGRLLLKTAPLTSSQPLPYIASDLASSQLRDQRVPEIVSAYSIRPVTRYRKRLRPLTLPSGHVFDPRYEDLPLCLVEERDRLENDPDLPLAERERRGKLAKLIVNAICYGLLCQLNVQTTGGKVNLTRLDGTTTTIRVDTLEEPGRRTLPLSAAGVTATGRLLLQLARHLFEQQGWTILHWDTDSCAAKPPEDSEKDAEVLTARLGEIQQRFQQLSPYPSDPDSGPDRRLLLELEPENFDPDTGAPLKLHLHATASKNYDLYTLHTTNPAGTTLRKWSEHGLGHLRTPGDLDQDDRGWIKEGRAYLLRQHLGLHTTEPNWWQQPGYSIVTLNRPDELTRLNRIHNGSRRTRRQRLLPFSRIVVAHPHPLYATRNTSGERQTPVTPYHAGFNPHSTKWRDLTTGQPLTVRYTCGHLSEGDLIVTPGRVLCDTIGATLERNSRRPEAKAIDSDGWPCGPHSTGPLRPSPTEAYTVTLIGKETRNLERAGITEEPSYTLYTDAERDSWREIFLPALRKLAPGSIPPGRPSRHQRAQLARRAGELARAALREGGGSVHGDPERACYLYLKSLTHRTCACGCGEAIGGRAIYIDGAHRMRAYRQRRGRS